MSDERAKGAGGTLWGACGPDVVRTIRDLIISQTTSCRLLRLAAFGGAIRRALEEAMGEGRACAQR